MTTANGKLASLWTQTTRETFLAGTTHGPKRFYRNLKESSVTTDEAKGLFALMNWQWIPLPLAEGNNKRGRMDDLYSGRYAVFVNEVMVNDKIKGTESATVYETYDVDKCLTRYAELYLVWVAEKPRERAHDRRG